MTVIRAREEPQGPHDPNGLVISSLRTADWQPDEVPVYISGGAFASHLVDQLEPEATDEFPGVFGEIERLLHEGDPGVRYVVTWGLLEGLGNRRGPWIRRKAEAPGHLGGSVPRTAA